MGVAIFPGGLKNIHFWRVLKPAGINPVARWLHWWEIPEFIATPVGIRRRNLVAIHTKIVYTKFV